MFAYSTRSENEILGCLTVKSVRKRVSPSRSFHFVTVVKYFDISQLQNDSRSRRKEGTMDFITTLNRKYMATAYTPQQSEK